MTGSLPPELIGRYLRNGPNPLPGHDPGHWFAGAGMLHGIRLRDGRAEWYRNRWVGTRLLEGSPTSGRTARSTWPSAPPTRTWSSTPGGSSRWSRAASRTSCPPSSRPSARTISAAVSRPR
ncbi:carotenoid oxygenase family protein [Pseudonocardia nantongensis]|uniref:carotenoid oxygenase family protein n=1 Tax=Pseudonocardia nantongensis TaxID=1181885 RepID=UPI00397845D3